MVDLSNNKFFGIYIHIPFCAVRCPYCNFCSVTDLSKVEDYFFALSHELGLYKNKSLNIDTIYFGGGTPSIVNFGYVDEVIETIHENFSVVATPEITIEVNPGSASFDKLKHYYSSGINRLSIGMQSLDQQALCFLGRTHSIRDSFSTFFKAREIGFNNIGIDLIYGIPGQVFSKWSQTLGKIVSMAPDHLSCYLLTLEPGTLVGDKFVEGRVDHIDDFNASTMFIFTEKFLNESGYYRYEVSNFSKMFEEDGKIYLSKHNSKYWNFHNYLGFGLSAHSLTNNIRWWNETSINNYIHKLLVCNTVPIAGKEELTLDEQMNEFIYLGFRQSRGIDTNLFAHKFGVDFLKFFEKPIGIMLKRKFIKLENDNAKLTDIGFLFLDTIASSF